MYGFSVHLEIPEYRITNCDSMGLKIRSNLEPLLEGGRLGSLDRLEGGRLGSLDLNALKTRFFFWHFALFKDASGSSRPSRWH